MILEREKLVAIRVEGHDSKSKWSLIEHFCPIMINGQLL